MKKIAYILTFAAILASCTAKPTNHISTGATVTGTTTTIENSTVAQHDTVFVRYTLRDNDANGKILDTNILADKIAQDPNADKNAVLKPLEVTFGNNQVIPGFEANLKGMKIGDKKSFVVEPKDGYGEAMVERTVQKQEIAPKFEMELETELLQGKASRAFTITELQHIDKDVANKKVGDVITNGNMTGSILAKNDKEITLGFELPNAPFFKKELKIGATGESEGVTYKILSIKDKKATLEVNNPNSPFAGKEFKEGANITRKEMDPILGQEREISIVIKKIEGDNITIETTNPHHLGGKKLHFTVEVVKNEEENTTNTIHAPVAK